MKRSERRALIKAQNKAGGDKKRGRQAFLAERQAAARKGARGVGK